MNKVNQDEQAVNPASPEFFFGAETAYAEASGKMLALMKDRWGEQQRQAAARNGIKDIEARLVASGQIEGGNETARKAHLTILLGDDPEANAVQKVLVDAEAALAQIDIDMESARSMRDLMRYRMRYADATLRYLANIPPESPHESEA